MCVPGRPTNCTPIAWPSSSMISVLPAVTCSTVSCRDCSSHQVPQVAITYSRIVSLSTRNANSASSAVARRSVREFCTGGNLADSHSLHRTPNREVLHTLHHPVRIFEKIAQRNPQRFNDHRHIRRVPHLLHARHDLRGDHLQIHGPPCPAALPSHQRRLGHLDYLLDSPLRLLRRPSPTLSA